MELLTRIPGWEKRLAAAIANARRQTYTLGVWDCFRFPCAVVEALTGVDRWPEFAGSYATRGEALRRIAEHGGSFEAAATWFFGSEPIAPTLARRGDMASCRDPAGDLHLAVVTGPQMLSMGEGGVVVLPRSAAINAWRVG